MALSLRASLGLSLHTSPMKRIEKKTFTEVKPLGASLGLCSMCLGKTPHGPDFADRTSDPLGG